MAPECDSAIAKRNGRFQAITKLAHAVRAAMETISNEFGSADGYLDVAAGLDARKREHLRELALS